MMDMMILPHKSKEGCQHKDEDGEPPCGQPQSGRGAWRYCPIHGVVAKRKKAKEVSKNFREEHPELVRCNSFLCTYNLTENKLKSVLDRAESLKLEALTKDDLYLLFVE